MGLMTKVCCDCGEEQPEGWPDKDGRGELCQMCWESQCAEAWWEAMATGAIV